MSRRPSQPAPPRAPESVGVVIVRRFDDGWRFLVLRSGDRWDFAATAFDPDDDPLTAGQREAWARLTLTDLAFDWGDDFRETVSYRGSPVSRYYLAESPGGAVVLAAAPSTGAPAWDEFRWVSADGAEDLLPPRLALVLDWARETIAR